MALKLTNKQTKVKEDTGNTSNEMERMKGEKRKKI